MSVGRHGGPSVGKAGRVTEKRLQLLLRAMAVVATTAGADAVVRGARSVPDAGVVAPNVDSEFRFYASWYVAAGALLWTTAAVAEAERRGWPHLLLNPRPRSLPFYERWDFEPASAWLARRSRT